MSVGQFLVLVITLIAGFFSVGVAIIGSSYTRTEVLGAKLDDIVDKLGDIAARRLP